MRKVVCWKPLKAWFNLADSGLFSKYKGLWSKISTERGIFRLIWWFYMKGFLLSWSGFTLVSARTSGREALLSVIQNSFVLYIQKDICLRKNSSHNLSTSHTGRLKGKKLSIKHDLIGKKKSNFSSLLSSSCSSNPGNRITSILKLREAKA